MAWVRTIAVDGELLPPHQLVDELRDELLGVLVGPVHVVAPRDDDGKVERPDHTIHGRHNTKVGPGGLRLTHMLMHSRPINPHDSRGSYRIECSTRHGAPFFGKSQADFLRRSFLISGPVL